ncbi:tRNA pseudouridine(55) synthase TruB [Halobacillus fulvus]|nr:tRNA pseudouridine(55) synthase TruB [Halobacillus fulvus]
MDGILPLWKPKGFTSHDCVSKARGIMRTKKIGHTGTLDPEVEGVLPLCVGKATKIVPFLTDTEKVYEAEVTLGYSTDTEDATGSLLEKSSVHTLDQEEVEHTLRQFEGDITQIPPMYSAVKVKGKKLYEYAREGIEVERPSRRVTIRSIELTKDVETHPDETATFSIRVVCSKGTYIRTLCVDIGQAIGYPAHMSHLVRTRTGDIGENDCLTFEEIQHHVDEGQAREDLLLPISSGLSHLEVWDVNEQVKNMVDNGRVLEEPTAIHASPFVVSYEGEALAIYEKHPRKPGLVKPVRVFK